MSENKRSKTEIFSILNLFRKNNKGALEISFGWLFAIIAGGVILFLAIYLGSRIIGTSDETTSAEVGEQINILLNPLETSFESSQTTSITIPSETRINNLCGEETPFGRQTLQIDQMRFGKWTETNTRVHSFNKYIFSKEQTEGRTFYLFSKPFDFPFKVANLIYLISANEVYCFMNAPADIKQEITNLNKDNLVIEPNCTRDSIKVCFSGGCDITVNYKEGTVRKGKDTFYFSGIENSTALMYAAIFSDKEVYECQVKRLMMRVSEISMVYYDKELLTRRAECDDTTGTNLFQLANSARDLNSSIDLSTVKFFAQESERSNEGRRCLLW